MKTAIIYCVIALFLLGCDEENEMSIGNSQNAGSLIAEISTNDLERLAGQSIYFGHQSVGNSIVKGIEEVLAQDGRISLNIEESRTRSDLTGPVLVHFWAGENRKPLLKIEDFKTSVSAGSENATDIAFLKFCFVDFEKNTNVQEVFQTYVTSIDQLKIQNPNTLFVHFTSPLTTIQKGPKALVKKVLGMDVWGVEENIKRQQYNELLKNKYSEKEPVFDIAAVESTKPDGTRVIFTKNDEQYYAMFEDYTTDGGHLNENARKIVAAELIKFLAKLV